METRDGTPFMGLHTSDHDQSINKQTFMGLHASDHQSTNKQTAKRYILDDACKEDLQGVPKNIE